MRGGGGWSAGGGLALDWRQVPTTNHPPTPSQAFNPRITRAAGTHAMVLSPTRELAVQISDVLVALCRWVHGAAWQLVG
jgi:hypothetical protein